MDGAFADSPRIASTESSAPLDLSTNSEIRGVIIADEMSGVASVRAHHHDPKPGVTDRRVHQAARRARPVAQVAV